MTQQGLCTNLPSACSKSAAQERIDMTGPDGRCPECGQALRLVSAAGSRRQAVGLISGAVVVLGGLAAAGFWWSGRHKGTPGAPDVTNTTPPSNVPQAQDTAEVLRLHGSNTVGASLAPALVEAFLKREGYGEIKRTAGANAEESVVRGLRASDGRSIRFELAAHGTSTAFTALAEGKADIGMASRAVNADELTATKTLGDLRSAACEYVIALDGVAVVVNAANPVRQLSIAQVRALFSGRTTDWARVGGTGGTVKLYARDDKSGTTDTFKALVLGKDKIAAEARRYEDSAELSQAVASDPDGIGFIGMPYVKSTRALAISDGDTTAFRPTRITVATEDYPLSRRLYLYLPARASVLARKFIDFAGISDEGQLIAERVGFVGQIAKPSTPSPNPGDEPVSSRVLPPADYVRLTRGAERLPVTLRFRFGSADLDNLAAQNVKRIAQRIEAEAGKVRVMVFGFGDSRGSASATVQVSQERADAVARELRSWGPVAQEVRGFGAAVPLADNDTDAGRERNRRAEVWILPGTR